MDSSTWGRRGTAAASVGARLEFDGITHRYDRLLALDNVSLAIDPGQILCLLGHSGCGKTTLLRIGAGVERQETGTVKINGQVVSSPDAFTPPENRGIGLMFQDYALFPHLTILRNVMFGLGNMSAQDAEAEALRSLARMGMDAYAASYPHALSGGEQQRVALARAIAPRPSVLLMDEPFSGLDQRLRDTVRDETLAVLRETRATCVLVTHDPEEAMQVGDRIGLMRRGGIAQIGSPEELYSHPGSLFAARFFSPLNEFDAKVEAGSVETPFGRFEAAGLGEGSKAKVAMRPQALKIAENGDGRRAHVTGCRFLGDVDAVEFAIEGYPTSVKGRIAHTASLNIGDEVSLNADPRYVLVFSAEAE